MSAIGTLMATAAVAVGAVHTAKAISRRLRRRRAARNGLVHPRHYPDDSLVIDLENRDGTGVWRAPDGTG